MSRRIIVIGGGMAGASVAYHLRQLGYKVTILEKNDRLGGRIHSHSVDGAAVEMGAAFLTKSYTNLWAFLEHSGLSAKLYATHGHLGIYRRGKVHMATGRTVLGSQALSWNAKLRTFPAITQTFAAWPKLDRHAFWKAAPYDDRSVADMLSGTGDRELLEYVVQPVLNGYFYWTPEHTSRAMMLMLCREAFSHGTYNLAGGLQRIPEKLAESSTVLLEHTAQEVTYSNGLYTVTILHNGTPKILTADGIVCATTASMVPCLFPDIPKIQKEFFSAVAYSSGALVAKTYQANQTLGDKAIAFPRQEGIELSSVTASSETLPDRVPLVTVKTYASGSSAAKLGTLSDKALAAELTHMMKPVRSEVVWGNATPIATFTQRWPQALPYFDVGHFKRLQAFADGKIEDAKKPLVFAGDYLGGPFMEGAFTSGQQTAHRLHSRLLNNVHSQF